MLETVFTIEGLSAVVVLAGIGFFTMSEEHLPGERFPPEARWAITFLMVVFAPLTLMVLVLKFLGVIVRSLGALGGSFSTLYRTTFPTKVTIPRAKVIK
jgi:hypothetical protein